MEMTLAFITGREDRSGRRRLDNGNNHKYGGYLANGLWSCGTLPVSSADDVSSETSRVLT